MRRASNPVRSGIFRTATRCRSYGSFDLFRRGRGGRRFFGLRDGRVFFHMAGGGPFGEFGGIILVRVPDDGVQHMQGDARLVRGVFQAAGGFDLIAGAGAFGGDGRFKRIGVGLEMGDEIGGQTDADEQRLERHGIGGKGAGAVEQGLVAIAVGHEEFAAELGMAEQDEGMHGVGDAEHVRAQLEAAGDFGEDAAVNLFGAGILRGTERALLRHGGVNEGKLLAAEARERIIGGVFEAIGVSGFEGGEEAGDFVLHNIPGFMLVSPS